MHIKKNYTVREIFLLTGKHFSWLVPYVVIVAVLYRFTPLREFNLPWLPLSLIGTAVAFYVGFKNNQAYDRIWEARIVWGGIVNSSRIWGSNVKAFIVDGGTGKTEQDLLEIKKLLFYRHIAWLYKLRSQLLEPTSWEHVSLRGPFGRDARSKMKRSGIGLYGHDITDSQIRNYLVETEYSSLSSYKNAAAQMIDIQSQELAATRKLGCISEYEHVKLQGILDDFYDHQGKAERIKKTPFPRQFGSYGFIMICLFIVILPFGFFPEFNKIGNYGVWLAIPFIVIISWVYIIMELVGDYSENPFEGLENDVPMLSICRNIEIDLLQQLGETSLPQPIQSINNVLM
jgi:ion channel-forming bestrophin family protein